MALVTCRECEKEVSSEARQCPHCGIVHPANPDYNGIGFDWKSRSTILGYPLIHIAVGKDKYGKLRVAKGFIAIGQFAVGVITIAQFGIGWAFGLGQFMLGTFTIAQFAGGLTFALGQFAVGFIAMGQLAVGYYCLHLLGWGVHERSFEKMNPIEFLNEVVEHMGLFPAG